MAADPLPHTSVALCTCNGERWIAEQLQSILSQDCPVDEIILSDDASSDATLAIARAILETGSIPFLILEAEERMGFVSNFEKAARHCQGEVIFFCDQDDIWEREKVSTVLRLIPGQDWLASDAALIGPEGTPLPSSLWLRIGFKPSLNHDSADLARTFLRRPFVTGATLAVRRKALEGCLPFPAEIPHDQWISLILAISGHAVRFCPSPLLRYRIHNSQQIGLRNESWQSQARTGLKTSTSSYQIEADHTRRLLEHLETHAPEAPHLHFVRDKLRHMEARAALGSKPISARAVQVFRELCSGRYRYSWSRLAPIKDLLKPRKEDT